MSEVADPSLMDDVQEDQTQQVPKNESQQEEAGAPSQEQPQEQEASKPVSKEDVASIVSEAFRQSQPQGGNQQPQQQQLSEEEIAERLKVAKFDDDFASNLRTALTAEEFEPQKVVGIINNLRDKLMDQATTYTQLAVLKIQQDLEKKFNPALQHMEQQSQEQLRQSFFKKYPVLNKFQKLLPIAAQAIGNKQFGTNEELFDAMAKETERLIKEVNPNFQLGQAKSGEPKPASMMRGGQSGVGEAQNGARHSGADPSIM